MGLSIWHLLIVLAVVLVVFGAGRLPQVMGDLGKGIRSFKAGLNAEDKDKLDEKFTPPSLPLNHKTEEKGQKPGADAKHIEHGADEIRADPTHRIL